MYYSNLIANCCQQVTARFTVLFIIYHICLQSISNVAILIVYSVHTTCSARLSVQGEGSIPLSKVYSIFDLLNWNLFLRVFPLIKNR